MLAKHNGHRAFFCSGSPQRRAALEKFGIETIDQKGKRKDTTFMRMDAPKAQK